MKDAYSFHLDPKSMQEGYDKMYAAYTRIFTRMQLKFRAVDADTGSIGGSKSHEFHVLADSGEDAIAFSDGDHYAANLEMAVALPPATPRPAPIGPMTTVATPNARTIAEVAAFLQVPASHCVKTLLVEGSEGQPIALVVRGDHELNVIKAQKLPGVTNPLKLASAEQVAALGSEAGFIGPVGLAIKVYADHSALALGNFVCGANRRDQHLTQVNWGRDLPEAEAVDIRNVVAGDPSPSGKGQLGIARGIEVGHVFQLGRKYSEPMQATVLDEQGKATVMYMGCYGIGVTRVVAAAIEQNHDERGIIWPDPLAPFTVSLIPINMHRSPRVRETAESLYAALAAAGIDVLCDDRDLRPGVKFADDELLGIPHRFTIGEKGLDRGILEYRARRGTENIEVPIDNALAFLREQLARTQ
jgi:prolyl-tRNA synthetase